MPLLALGSSFGERDAPQQRRFFFWNWTERLLRRDAEAGRTSRAVWWDYLCVAIDWAMGFLMFAAVAFGVFALARGSGMPRTAMWLCVAGLYTLPFAFRKMKSEYPSTTNGSHEGFFPFFF